MTLLVEKIGLAEGVEALLIRSPLSNNRVHTLTGFNGLEHCISSHEVVKMLGMPLELLAVQRADLHEQRQSR